MRYAHMVKNIMRMARAEAGSCTRRIVLHYHSLRRGNVKRCTRSLFLISRSAHRPTVFAVARAIQGRDIGKDAAKSSPCELASSRAAPRELIRAVRLTKHEIDKAGEVKPLPKGPPRRSTDS